MQLFKATLKLHSSLITQLKGDTIWGHIVWGIANHEGDGAVEKFLEEEKSGQPSLVVSSAFPKGTICKPYPPHIARKENLSADDYAKIKKSKKQKFVYATDYFAQTEKKIPASSAGMTQKTSAEMATSSGNNVIVGLDPTISSFEKVSAMHNSINRFSGTVEGSSLFAASELWAENPDFDLYVLSSYPQERVKELLTWAFENGFGADSSTGKGKIEVGNVVKVETKHFTGKYVALAPFVLNDGKTEIKNPVKEGTLNADIFVRTGKIGGAFSSFMSPFKKTVLMFDEGAVFESGEDLQFIGKLLTDVHSDKRICQSGFAPVLPV